MNLKISTKNCEETSNVTCFTNNTVSDVHGRLNESVIKSKVRRLCWDDKTKCRLSCAKCKSVTGHLRSFSSPGNLCRHIAQSHTLDKNENPSVDFVLATLEEISNALQKNIPLSEISNAVKLGMII